MKLWGGVGWGGVGLAKVTFSNFSWAGGSMIQKRALSEQV